MRFLHHLLAAGLAAIAVIVSMGAGGAARAQAAQPGVYDARIVALGPARNQITLAFPAPIGKKTFSVSSSAANGALTFARLGDVATVEVDNVAAPTAITKVDQVVRWIDFGTRAVTFLVVAVILLIIAFVVAKGRPWKLLIGDDNRLSNSQVQLALWWSAVALIYLSAVWLRAYWLDWDFVGGVGITNNVMILTGLSAISFGGAKAIAVQKAASPAAAAAPGPAARTSFFDLFNNDAGKPDLGDIQMILITVLAVIIFVVTSFHFLGKLALVTPITLPDVDTTLLAGFGIGQGAYLFKKAALPPGQG